MGLLTFLPESAQCTGFRLETEVMTFHSNAGAQLMLSPEEAAQWGREDAEAHAICWYGDPEAYSPRPPSSECFTDQDGKFSLLIYIRYLQGYRWEFSRHVASMPRIVPLRALGLAKAA